MSKADFEQTGTPAKPGVDTKSPYVPPEQYSNLEMIPSSVLRV